MANLKDTVVFGKLNVTDKVVADKIVKLGGTANEVLCADGSTTTLSGLGAGTVTSVGVANGGGLSVSGSPITSNGTITISHADTSSQGSMTTGGRTYVNSITLDGYGHVTAIGTGTESNQDLSNYVTLNTAQTISGDKTFTGNVVTSNDKFEIKAKSSTDDSWIKLTNSSDSGYYAFGIRRPYNSYGLQLKIHPTSGSDTYYNIWHAGNDGSGSGLDADMLDGKHASAFALASNIPSVSGFVTGPGSSTDNAIARFNSTTGKLIQNSNATINDDGIIIANGLGDGSITIKPHASNEINFGGTDTGTIIYFGHQGVDSRPKPTSYVFGGVAADASVQANQFIKTGSNDNYVLLGGGGHKALSEIGGSGGGGDVYGPSSSTDHAVVRFADTTGKNIQNSGVTIDDNGYLTAPRLTVYANGNGVTIGSQNQSFCHIYNSASIPFIFNNTVASTAGTLGTSSYPWKGFYINGNIYKGSYNYTLPDATGTIALTSDIPSFPTNYVTTDTAQTISGTKTFTNGMKVSGRFAGGGDDEGIIVGRADNGYAGLCLGEPSGVRSVFYLTPTNEALWRYVNGSGTYDIKHPGKAGTIALTSDIPTDTGMTSVTVSGGGNAVTSASYSSSTHTLTLTKGSSFMPSTPTSIELNSGGGLLNYGGFIDFHFHDSSGNPKNSSGNIVSGGVDYSSRIIEDLPGRININSVHFKDGSITASKFVKSGSSDSYVLLGGGGHKALSEIGSSIYITSGARDITMIGYYATSEGEDTTAYGDRSHAEGTRTTASGDCSHAEGEETTASGNNSHAEGSYTTASGAMSHAEGYQTTASGNYSHAAGYCTIANQYQYAVGKYNANTTAPTSLTDTTAAAGLFIVGIGTSDSARNNGFRVNPAGKVYGVGTFGTSGADYAEYFEWFDGNPNNEDRRGHFVTLEGDKIRYATANDDYILGVVSADPSVAGDMYSEDWHKKYLKDVFGNNIVEIVDVEETTNEFGEIIPAHTERRWVLNPDYNPDLTYISREERPEWAAIGIVGKLVVVDDGTCQVNGYCYPNTNGIGTASDNGYRVIERIDENHIKVFIK